MNSSGPDPKQSVSHRSLGPLSRVQFGRYALAILSVALVSAASLLLEHFNFRVPAALLLLFAVAVSSWYGGVGAAVLATLLSIISFYWCFVEPVRTIYIYWSEIPHFIIFVAFAALLSWFGTVRRRVEAELRDRAALLNLTHDTVFVMSIEGVIRYWNRGAEERYGWSSEQAMGKVVHDMLQTVFPSPLDEIKAELARTGRWEGELQHTRKDGTQVVVASRWSLQRDQHGAPFAILETNNDISERKRAEEAMSRLNRELRAISNCNQALLRATDEQSLLNEICRIVCEEAGYGMAWVAYAEADEAKSVRHVAWTGTDEEYLAKLGLTWADSERGCGPTGTAIRSGTTCYVQDLASDPRILRWREDDLMRGFLSAIALPLKDEHGNTFGSLTIHSAQANAFTAEEIRLLEELAADLAFGIVTLRTKAARKRAEQALRQSEAYLEEAQGLTHTGSWALDVVSGEYAYWSAEMFRIFGMDPQLRPPKVEQVLKAIDSADRDKIEQAISTSFLEKDTTFEFKLVRPDGTVKHIQCLTHPVPGPKGAVVEVVGTIVDITERKLAEKALRQSEAYLAETQRLTHTGTWVVDRETEPLFWSEELFRIFGFDPQQGLPKRGQALERIHPEDRDKFMQAFDRAIHEKIDSEVEYRIVLPGGTARHAHGIGHAVCSANGEVVEVVGTTLDITQRKRAEEALRRTTAYLTETQRLTHTGTFVADNMTTPLYWSEEVFRLFGFDPNHGLPTRDQPPQRVHPEDREKFWQAWRRAIQEKADAEVEYRIILPDGTVKYAYGTAHPVLDANGELVEVMGSTVDITQRKRAEQELRESETRFRTFVDHAADAFGVFDEQHKLIDVNRETCESLGYSREELIGRVPQSFDQDVDAARLRWIDEQIGAGEVCTFETRHRRKDGTLFPVEVRVGAFQLGDRRLHLALARDISERKRAQEELRESETRFRTFVDHAGDALVVQDFEHGTIVDVNRQACESVGYTREELIGKTPLLFHLDAGDDEMKSVLARAEAGETVFDTHLHRRKDGSVFPVEVHASVFWHGGRRFLLKVARDISDRMRAEEQRERLRQLEADLAHLDRLTVLGELTASIAHEVNQPLSGVVSNASACLRWLAGEAPNLEEAREATRRIVRDGKRAAEVIARTRALATKNPGAMDSLVLGEVFRDVLPLVEEVAKKNRVRIRTEFAAGLSPVAGDRVQLQQVLLNLVMNAIDAMSTLDGGARELVITARNLDPEQVEVTVEDCGIGLDPSAIQRVFDPFYTTKPGGMGMGLSVCRSIVRTHGGRLWATANDGPGATFHFTLAVHHEEGSNAAVAGA